MLSSRSDRREAGFTIVELAAALVLIMLVTTFAITAWFGRSDVTLQNAAELLIEDLRHVQTRAILEHTPVEVLFDVDGGGYRARELVGPELPDGARRYTRDAVFEDVRIGAVRVQGGGPLAFDALGHPASDASITLTQADGTRTVLVHARSSVIEIEGHHP